MIVLIFCVLIFIVADVRGQGSADYKKGVRFHINDEEDKFVRLIFWNQFWACVNENNPSTYVNGEHRSTTTSFGARRMRLLTQTQISSRYQIIIHVGVNNQSFGSGGAPGAMGNNGVGKKPQLFFHDAYNEYAIVPVEDEENGDKKKFNLYAGAGLHYWNGLSRMTSGSTLNFLMIDAPVFNWPTVDVSDQFGRQFGVYAKGGYQRLLYQFHVNKPFVTNGVPIEGLGTAVDNNGDPNPSYGGYIEYQFLEEESQSLPYRVGTYIGTKKVFNIGGGFYHHANATKSSLATGSFLRHDISLFSLDAFLDLPIGARDKNMALTLYGVYYNFDFGPKYSRTIGIMNPGAYHADVPHHSPVLEGAGNARMLLGTGKLYYVQSGWLLPKFKQSKTRIQPISALAVKALDVLKGNAVYYDVGTNVYLDGHYAKLTLQYSSRPLHDIHTHRAIDRKGEFLIQFQVYL